MKPEPIIIMSKPRILIPGTFEYRLACILGVGFGLFLFGGLGILVLYSTLWGV